MEAVWLQHVWMSSNDHLYTKRHQMFAYMKLAWKWSSAKFLSKVHEDNNDVNFGL